MTPVELRARIRVEPRHLYWRWRLLNWEGPPRGTPRALLMQSLMQVSRALDGRCVPPLALRDWTLKEARAWVALLRGTPRSHLAVARARAFFQLARSSVDPEAFVAEAMKHFGRVPVATRRAHPLLWGELLLAGDLAQFEAALPQVLAGLKKVPSADLGMRTIARWARDARLSQELQARIRRFVDELPDRAVHPGVRLELSESDGVAALAAGDLAAAERALTAMAAAAELDWFPGNRTALVEKALDAGQLKEACRAFLAVVLTKEWRSWVRPGIERLAQRCQ